MINPIIKNAWNLKVLVFIFPPSGEDLILRRIAWFEISPKPAGFMMMLKNDRVLTALLTASKGDDHLVAGRRWCWLCHPLC
jgi:hypothetical protein